MFDINMLKDVEILKQSERQKLIRVTDAEGNNYLKRIINGDKREVYKLLSKIKHSGIPTIYYVGFDENTVVIEEYVDGKSLNSLMEEAVNLDKQQIKKISNQILSTMEALHRVNIIHRDIKPDNIIIDNRGNAWLTDFDIARIYRNEVRRDTEAMGTFGYAPIEQFGLMPTDFKTDIYAFGITLKTLLEYSGIKGYLFKVAKKCSRLDPSLRYADVKQVQNALNPKKLWPGIFMAVLAVFICFFAANALSEKKPAKADVEMQKSAEKRISIEEKEKSKEKQDYQPEIVEEPPTGSEQKETQGAAKTEIIPSAESEELVFVNQFSGFSLGKFEEKVLECSNFPYVSVFLTDEEYTHVFFLDDIQKKGKIKLGENRDIIDAEFTLKNGQMNVYLSDSKGNTFTHLFQYNNQFQYKKQYTVDLRKNADIMCYDLDNDGADELLIGLNECSIFIRDSMVYNNCNYCMAWCIEYDSKKGFNLYPGDMISIEGPFTINRFAKKLNISWENFSDITGYYIKNGEIVPSF